jgi:Zn finger protein HypA/HybF involved in hydrogenase expression
MKNRIWIETAIRILKNSEDKVMCPNCDYKYLKIEKVPWPNFEKVDIHMSCEKCGARNVITTEMLHTT